jgi:hypothetical protein
MSASRETVRGALADLLTTALVGTGLPAQAAYGYPVADFGGQSPIVLIASAGSTRDVQTLDTRRTSRFFFTIIVFVLYADAGSGWTEADAEDALDTIESVIDDTIATNLVNGTTWADAGYDGRTRTGNATIGGVQYRYEVIPIRVEVFHD